LSKIWPKHRTNRSTNVDSWLHLTYGCDAHRVGRDAARAVADSMERRTNERAVALVKGQNRRIAAETTMHVQIAEPALACVTCGFGSRIRRLRAACPTI
jgi:hypothetical protein